MRNELIKNKGSFLTNISNLKPADLARPFQQEIFLTESVIAGTSHIQDQSVLSEMKIEDRLIMIRRPENGYDPYAIELQDAKGRKAGFIPRKNNAILARLMDAGKELYGVVDKIQNANGTYWIVELKIFMRDF